MIPIPPPAHLEGSVSVSGSKLVRILQGEDGDLGLGWTKDGRLLAFEARKVHDLSRGRSAVLHRGQSRSGMFDTGYGLDLQLDSEGRRALGVDFVLDPETLRNWPLQTASLWEGDRLVEIEGTWETRSTLIRRGKRIRLASPWHLLGVSRDLRLALVSAKVPTAGDTTYLAHLDPRTGRVKTWRKYPRSSDDHTILSGVDRHASGGVLLHRRFLPTDFEYAYLGGTRLQSVGFRLPKDVVATSTTARWTHERQPRMLVHRRLFYNPAHQADGYDFGFDGHVLDLWDARTGRRIRVAKAIRPWATVGDREVKTRWKGPTLGTFAFDARRNKVAFVVQKDGRDEIYVRDFRTRVAP